MTPKFLAYYLPQYHPIPENDEWWGKGFTEWTNVTKARALYRGHLQPKLPTDLGFYDLRVPEVREAQAAMAKKYGVTGFCYYHYWFGNGKQLLNLPADSVLASRSPDIPFCFCWANQTWTGHWFGADKKTLIEQVYPGEDDIKKHFEYLLPFFLDPRYVRIDNKPVFKILDINHLPNPKAMANMLKTLAVKNGLDGLYLIAGNFFKENWNPTENNFDAVTDNGFNRTVGDTFRYNDKKAKRLIVNKYSKKLLGLHNYFYYRRTITFQDYTNHYKIPVSNYTRFPIVLPNWDNTPRSLRNGFVIRNAKPEYFKQQLTIAIDYLKTQNFEPVIFIKSWNEWAEGNYLEPDREFGYNFLETLKQFIETSQ